MPLDIIVSALGQLTSEEGVFLTTLPNSVRSVLKRRHVHELDWPFIRDGSTFFEWNLTMNEIVDIWLSEGPSLGLPIIGGAAAGIVVATCNSAKVF
jgi:hypothetical protein